MQLLLLLSACFTSCLAQTMVFTTGPAEMLTTEPTFSTIQPTTVDSTDERDSFAFLLTEVNSTYMLNITSLDEVLDKISSIIKEALPDAEFTLTAKSITEV
ncbi:hypothetical protein NL108_016924 [Boleophthalmus pectinirostris]|nr:hypothetical protein NL108_016924 [Boleophthalmus pectinirostris]